MEQTLGNDENLTNLTESMPHNSFFFHVNASDSASTSMKSSQLLDFWAPLLLRDCL